MATYAIAGTDSLIQRVQSLPSELYTEIYDLTLTVDIGTCLVDKAYRPPSILQLNKRWRSILRQSYYDKTIFEIPVDLNSTDNPTSNDMENLTHWLTPLISGGGMASPTLHILSEIRITIPIRSNKDGSSGDVVSFSSLTTEDQRQLESLMNKVSATLASVARPVAFSWWVLTDRKMKFRCLTDNGREVWWNSSLTQSRPTAEGFCGWVG